LICLASVVVSAASAAPRVASINLCSDQYLLALAKPEQVVSVTVLARNALRSAESDAAAGVPVNHGSAEEIAALKPDLVMADGFSNPATVALLRHLHIPVLVLDDPGDFAGIVQNVRRAALALGDVAQGEAVIARMDAALGPRAAAIAGRPVVAVLEPGGYTQGIGTLIDEAIVRAGGEGLGRRLGIAGYASLPLERLVAQTVDLMIVPGDSAHNSLAAAALSHPALQARFSAVPRLVIPGNLTDCATPASAAMVPLIRDALQ
jgi:iron complex transport system substrate-binding protein